MIDLLGHAQGTRWFGSRPAAVIATALTGWWVRPEGEDGVGVRSAFLDVVFDGEPARFHVPLGYVPAGSATSEVLGTEEVDGRPMHVVDATAEHRCRLALFRALADGLPGFELVRPLPSTDAETRRFGGEQSNTTIVLGDAVMMKVFRRLEAGPNPDLECHRALAESGAVAVLYGRWHHEGQDLALAVELLPDPVDGYVAAVDTATSGGDFRDEAKALGVALARVHRELADALGTDSVDGGELRAALEQRLVEAVAEAPELEPMVPALRRHYDAIAPTALPAQRIHGDCHLGQAIKARGSWYFVDFEGEPMVSLAVRRRPDLAVRDVAGMLRSFGYAAASGSPEWLADCRTAFLDGYGALTEAEQQVLLALEIDKACYEVRYERRYRPDMVHIPMSFLRELVAG
ncbi:phosphotransferase [Tessaracoccus caeni]|uniref:phosphotransferase n=1 Tax=Tessaracoccus caeni TaxID=3031239 RepID=UPI0023DB3D2F|nr:phosphotransferase [Tessaracoccus caeni]MDF1489462.1 phosphotransferase [Tessaracoccus caeni]